MKKYLFMCLAGLLLSACYFGDNPNEQIQISEHYYLFWFDNKSDQHLIFSLNENLNGGSILIEKTVFAVGSNDNFIIAKQHPDLAEAIQDRLYGRERNAKEDFEITNLNDTIYLPKGDSVYIENNKWYHTDRNRNSLPDSLKLCKGITNYYIIDKKNYDGSKFYTLYSFNNEKDYQLKRVELEIPESLTFTRIDKELE